MEDLFHQNSNSHRFSEEAKMIITHCPVCHYKHEPIEARVLEETFGAHLIYIKCRHCQSAVLALVLANNFGISSVGVITDLDDSEVIKFKDLPPISSDDVLAVYQSNKNAQIDDWLSQN